MDKERCRALTNPKVYILHEYVFVQLSETHFEVAPLLRLTRANVPMIEELMAPENWWKRFNGVVGLLECI